MIKEQLINEDIKFAEVRLIGPENEQLGIVSSVSANSTAQSYSLDLVCVVPDAKPPVCRIMDYGKFKFDQLKRLKDQKKSQKVNKLKEMSLSMTIDTHDLETKARIVRKFLENGDKVKVNIKMYGRMQAKPQIGVDIMNDFAQSLADISVIEKPAIVQGRNIFMYIAPNKK